MAVTRGIAAAAMLTGLAVGTASTACADTTMSGHYIATETSSDRTITEDWYFTSCGDGCAAVVITPGESPLQARLANGQWTMDEGPYAAYCPDGTTVPGAISGHATWDPTTLAGTMTFTHNVSACGDPAGMQQSATLQLRPAL
jgi:hypothetical protein